MGWATADGDNRGSWREGYKGTLDFSPSFSININLLSTLKFISLKKKKNGEAARKEGGSGSAERVNPGVCPHPKAPCGWLVTPVL